MKQIIRKSAIAVIALTGSIASVAQTTEKINIITTAVPFLRISPDAAAGGMGETGVATSADISSQFYNVAKYPFSEKESGISLNYIPWLKNLGLNDVYLASLAGYYKLDPMQSISASMRYFSLGDIQLMDNNGNDLQTEHPREMSVDLGYSRKLSDRLSLGVALRYINSNLVGNSSIGDHRYKAGNAFAGDLGLYYTTVEEQRDGWSFGVAMSNLGSKISYSASANEKSFLPANLGLGAGRTWFLQEEHKISLTGEINKLLVPVVPIDGTPEQFDEYNNKGVVGSWINSFDNKAMSVSGGLEYVYQGIFAVRAGYYSDSRSLGQRSYFTAGLGLNYNMLGVNFSYLVPAGNDPKMNPLANTVRFSLLFFPNSSK